MKRIPLGRGEHAIVDDADFDWLNQWKWWTTGGGKYKHYAQRASYPKGGGKIHISMHRLVLGLTTKIECDHINGNGLDNRRSNLRKCSKAQNACNRRPQKKKMGRFKGVIWRKETKKWRAMIRHNKRLIHLGSFDDEVAAAIAYNTASLKYHKEFGRLNEIPAIL